MNIEWNRVTWYSKIIAVILFVTIFFLGYWLGTMNVEKVYVEVPHVIHRSESHPITDAANQTAPTASSSVKMYIQEVESFLKQIHVGDKVGRLSVSKIAVDPRSSSITILSMGGNWDATGTLYFAADEGAQEGPCFTADTLIPDLNSLRVITYMRDDGSAGERFHSGKDELCFEMNDVKSKLNLTPQELDGLYGTTTLRVRGKFSGMLVTISDGTYFIDTSLLGMSRVE